MIHRRSHFSFFFFFNDTATTEIYTLSLHDALPIYMIQQSLQNALARAAVQRQVVTLATQTLCDANDPNLRQPSKPIRHALHAARVARLDARGVPGRAELPARPAPPGPTPPTRAPSH